MQLALCSTPVVQVEWGMEAVGRGAHIRPSTNFLLTPSLPPPCLTSPEKAEDGALAGATYISAAYTSTTSSDNIWQSDWQNMGR